MQIRACKLWQNTGKPTEQRRGTFFNRGKGGSWTEWVWAKVHWRKPRVQGGGGGFSLAEYGGFSLAGLLLGKKKVFLPPPCFCEVSFLSQSVKLVAMGGTCVRAHVLHFEWGFFLSFFFTYSSVTLLWTANSELHLLKCMQNGEWPGFRRKLEQWMVCQPVLQLPHLCNGK